MSDDQPRAIYLGLSEGAFGGRLSAVADDGAERLCAWPATARPAEVDRAVLQMLGFIGNAEVYVWDAEPIANLLAEPSLDQLARIVRDRLQDLLAGALIVMPAETDYSAEGFAQGLGIEAPDPNEPMAAARLCRELAEEVSRRALALPPPVLALAQRLVADHGPLGWLDLQRVELPDITGSALEMLVAGRPKAPAPQPRRRETLDAPLGEMSAELLSEEGAIATALDHYEFRAGQIDMARGVARALEGGEVLLVEAGTGVGKSLAYLVPGILWSRANAQPVIVSTNTKNLQEQLITKDLPLLQDILPVEFAAAIVKGRANYVCPHRFLAVMRECMGGLFDDEFPAAAYLASWVAASPTCDLDGVPAEAWRVFAPLRSMVGRLRSDRTNCMGRGCPEAKVCPMRVARAIGRNSDVIVSNHALTLADAGDDVLPPYTRVIFDEAHNLEAVATDQLGSEVTNFTFSAIRRTFGGDGRVRGIADALSVAMAGGHIPPDLAERQQQLGVRLRLIDDMGTSLGEAVIAMCQALDPERDGARATVRLVGETRDTAQWDRVAQAAAQCRTLVGEADALMAQMAEGLAKLGVEGSALADLALQVGGARAPLMELEADLNAVMAQEDDEAPRYVCWADIRYRGRNAWWRLCAAPIQVGPALADAVYERRGAMVMTSATLTVDDSFEYIRQRLGLRNEPRVAEQSVSSPFDMPQQLFMCVPDDLPITGEPRYREAISDSIVNIGHAAGGGMLVLFTSRKEMDAVFEATATRLRDQGLAPICQYLSGPRSSLLAHLRHSDNTVLFGLKSFWEGVDVPGEALRCVVITKLPFAVPSDPIIAARCEQANRDGLNASSDYYIPEAIVGFKQGIGRLIRTTSDEGVVFILDKRLMMRNYGARFISSVPRCAFMTGAFDECLEESRRWLRQPSPANVTKEDDPDE